MTAEIKTQTLNEPLKEKKRDPYYDNIRLFLMFSVVFCHGLAQIRKTSDIVNEIYLVFHMFTMPCFVILTGFFAKGMAKGGTSKRLHIINIVLMYVIVQAVKIIIQGEGSILSPLYGNWFLTCMVFWYAALPAVNKFKPVFVMVLAVIAGLLIGLDSNTNVLLQTQRTFDFFPFFILGFYLDKIHADALKTRKVRIMGIVVLVITVIVCVAYWNHNVNVLMANGYYNYAKMKMTPYEGLVLRFLWYIIATAMSFGIACIIPQKNTRITVFGTRTLPIFIIHTIVYYYLQKRTDVFDRLGDIDSGIIKLLIVFAVSVIMTLVCGIKPIATCFNKFMGWDFKGLLKNESK